MKGVLLKKLIGLGRDEDGAALIITLALFMFLYAACAGVFAIGQTVKDKIHLQNACDAAAYSAAVVQADTLSRIATINRAMSWTYASLCRREMDYITYLWLDEVVRHYRSDKAVAESGKGGIGSEMGSADRRVKLRSSYPPYCLFEDGYFDSVQYSVVRADAGGLREQISQDKDIIARMNSAIEDLASRLSVRAGRVAREVLALNLPSHLGDNVRVNLDIKDASLYVEQETNESRFLKYSGEYLPDVGWYAVDHSAPIQRKYSRDDELRANWYWWCLFGGECVHLAHSDGSSVCHCEPFGIGHKGICEAGVFYRSHEYYFESGQAMPLKLKECYFGADGTITIGVARYNENPWSVLFRGISGFATDGERDGKFGIYGLFNPYRHVEWSWAISSAKAGYQHVADGGDEDTDGSKREYRVNYDPDKDVKWNLCTSDWDAVFVPVRKFHAFAGPDEAWNSAGSDFLRDFVEGDWEPLGGPSPAPSYNIVGKMPNLPLMHNGGGAYRNLNWSRLADLMFH